MDMKQKDESRINLIRKLYVYVSRSVHLEAVLDEVEVFSVASSRFCVVLQQDEQLLGELVSILLHCRKRKFQDPNEGLQRLRDHLHTHTHTSRVGLQIKHAETLYTNSLVIIPR